MTLRFLYCHCSFWYYWSALLQMGLDPTPQGFAMCIMSSAWLMFVLIIVASYTANLTVFLGSKTPHLPIDNITQVDKFV